MVSLNYEWLDGLENDYVGLIRTKEFLVGQLCELRECAGYFHRMMNGVKLGRGIREGFAEQRNACFGKIDVLTREICEVQKAVSDFEKEYLSMMKLGMVSVPDESSALAEILYL